MAAWSQIYTFVAGQVPTATNWNANPSSLSTLLSGALDKDNVDSTSADGIGVLNVNQTRTGTSTFTGAVLASTTLTVGVNDTGHDVKFFGASSGAFMEWDESADELEIRGATAAGPGKLLLSTGELTNVDTGILGRIDFQAPLDSAGTDAIEVGASIWAEADATFSSSVNTTDLVFAAATSEAAAAVMRMKKGSLSPNTTDGMSLGTTALNWSDLYLDSGGVINFDGGNVTVTHSSGTLTVAGNIVVGENGTGKDVQFFGDTTGAHMLWDESTDDLILAGAAQLYLYDAGGGEHLSSDGTDLTINSGRNINLTCASGDVVIPANIGITFGSGEKIEGDDTNLTVTSGAQIIMTPTTDTIFSNGTGVVVGHAAQMAINGATAEFQVLGTGFNDSTIGLGRHGDDANGTSIIGYTSRHATIGSIGIVEDNDFAIQIVGAVDDGNDFATPIGRMRFEVDDGSPAENAVGGAWTISTATTAGANTERMRINNAGAVFINETTNAEITQGLTINQNTSDNQIMCFKSTGGFTHHGFSSDIEVDTCGTIQKASSSLGGIQLKGISSGTQGLRLSGHATTDDADKDLGASGYVVISAAKEASNTANQTGTNANLLIVQDEALGTKFIVDKEGDLHADGSATTVYDDMDDMALLSAFDRDTKGYIEQDWERNLVENEKVLIDLGILGGSRSANTPAKERGLINYTGLARLHNSALRQVYTKLVETVERLTVAESKLKMLEA